MKDIAAEHEHVMSNHWGSEYEDYGIMYCNAVLFGIVKMVQNINLIEAQLLNCGVSHTIH